MTIPELIKKAFLPLAIATFLLLMLNLLDYALGRPFSVISHIINIDEEANIPTWLSSVILLLSSIAALSRARTGEGGITDRRLWYALALLFLMMSCEEVACLHERTDYLFRSEVLHNPFLAGSWLLIFPPIVLPVVCYLMYRFNRLLAPYPRSRRFIYFGLVIYFIGSVACEALLLMPFYDSLPPIVVSAEVFAEEALELSGALLVLHGLGLYT